MSAFTRLPRAFRFPWRSRDQIRDEVDEELRFHLDMRTAELVRRGAAEAEARAQAGREFGDVEAARRSLYRTEEVRERGRRRSEWLDELRQDLVYGARQLRRRPGFTAAAVFTLALGIGANTAVFSIVDATLLRELPYPAPERLVRLSSYWDDEPEGKISPAEYFDYADRLRSLEAMGVYAVGPANLTGDGAPERVRTGYLTAGTLPALGVAPAAGRYFTAAEDAPGGDAVMLGHGLWTRRWGASPKVLGSRIVVDGAPRTVVGVMPAGFRLPRDMEEGETTELFRPLEMDRAAATTARGSHFLEGVGRLRPDVSVEAADREIAGVAAGFSRDFPDDYPAGMRFGARAAPLREAVLGRVRPVLAPLLGAVALVLLIACANVANLLLVRMDARGRELAVRAALGAGRGRLVRQLLAEGALLAALGGAAGVLLAAWATRAVPLLEMADLPSAGEVRMDPAVLAFALGASLLSLLAFGLAPALHASRGRVHEALKESGRAGTGGVRRRRLRGALVAAEVALAVVLLLGAGLLIRSLAALHAVDPGFRTGGVLTTRVSLPDAAYGNDERVVGGLRELLRRVEEVPGVVEAGAVTNLPLASTLGDLNLEIEGRPLPEGAASRRADWQAVTPGYLRAVGMQVLRGRGIEPSDDERAPGVVLINESLARLYWPGEDPVGRRFKLGGGAGPGWVTIAGVVRDVRHAALGEPPRPEMYIPHAQFRFWNGGGAARGMTLAIHTRGDPARLAGPVREAVRAFDPDLPLADVRTLAEVRSESVARPRFLALLLGAFAAVALVLAATGIYGTLAYLVAQRTYEMGVRMALGARPSAIRRLVVREGLAMALAGVAVGLPAAFALSRLIGHLLYGVAPTDAATFVAVPLGLALTALVASYLPARRATRVDPRVALRGGD
ncbi:MAG TPA: ABC transporter permease [Longimicrobiaceae bacterium]|nr:ABC transporter permease [Longimicrobiaceae bacterium]